MTIWDGLLQGLIQGLTEFLPVSSSGHLSLYQHFTKTSGEGALLFSVMLHLGTLAAVVAVYYQDLWEMLKEVGYMAQEIARGEFTLATDRPARRLLYMLFFACLPMLLLIPLNSFVTGLAEDKDIVVEGVFFLLTSLLLFIAHSAKPGKASIGPMKARHALTIGGIQAVASVPGLSRSGSTISGGIILGFEPEFAAKFSFLLGIPAILGGAVFQLGDAVKQQITVPVLPLVIGVVTAAVSGYLCIRFIKFVVRKNKLNIFAWYTLVLGVVVTVIGIIEHIAA